MRWLVWLCAMGIALCVARGARAADAQVRRFALVIGNNRPEAPSAELLRYADDDAVASHLLLTDADVQSLLFVSLDEATRGLHPTLTIAGAPRWSEIERGFSLLVARMKEAQAQGAQTEFLFFYSGHGDVDGGEGHVVLEGQRLTRSMLFSLLSRSPATHNHVFIDACKSYFLVFDRGPGGRRTPYVGNWAERVPARLGNTGFVLSTSSDRASHEWERYQGGILSHELRSGLRGAADADLDGAVSYAELGAFLVTANRAIQNPRFKPDFMVRAPGHDLEQKILSHPARVGLLYFAPRDWGHFYVENARGERVLDAHPRAGQALRLLAPAERPLFVRRNDERGEYAVETEGAVEVAALSSSAPEIAQRGAQSLAFQWTFSTPFGEDEVRDFRALAVAERDESPETKPTPSSGRRTVARVAGITALTTGAAGLFLSAAAIQTSARAKGTSQANIAASNERVVNFNRASLVCYGTALAAGLTWAWAKWWPESKVTVSASSTGPAVGDGLMFDISRNF
ncbi:MAG TPA: caspase family protein [Polyangiaceae bacterium]|nr:caspase family protein [Polyangiaceae bacterium]